MKNLFFVSVAAGIFSGTSLSVKAQNSVNTVKFGAQQKKSVQFIEGIEIKRDAEATAAAADLWAVNVKKNAVNTNLQFSSNTFTGKAVMVIESCSPLQFKFAQLMDTDVENLTNTKLYSSINNWWATRYHYGGTTKKGIDCSAFTGAIFNESFGIILPRTARDQYAKSQKIRRRENLEEGDLVFFNTRGGVSHTGVYLGNGYFVHASVHAGVTINSLNDDYYNRKYIGGGRISAE